jgi:hypothetical protein
MVFWIVLFRGRCKQPNQFRTLRFELTTRLNFRREKV